MYVGEMYVSTRETALTYSVANWQKFRPQNKQVAPQKSRLPEKSAAEFLADFYKMTEILFS
jgi:hypothetical protein